MQYRGVDSPNDVNDGFYETVTISVMMAQSYTIPGLMAYSTYNVSVRATNQYGVGEFSEEVTVRTEEGGVCVALCSRKSTSTDDVACMYPEDIHSMASGYRQAQEDKHTHVHVCMYANTCHISQTKSSAITDITYSLLQ